MYEVEVKVPGNHEPVRQRLEALNADEEGTVRQVDTYLDHPTRDFAVTDEAIRVRREAMNGETTVALTYKGPLMESESKTREELETVVGDGDTIESIFANLDFDAAATVEKTRHRYSVRGYTVSLDDVVNLGTYVEVERAVPSESGVEAAREGVIELLEDLNLDHRNQIRTSYLGLLLKNAQK